MFEVIFSFRANSNLYFRANISYLRMNNFRTQIYRTRYTTYNKLLEIESEDLLGRKKLEIRIRSKDISFIGTFIHSFPFFFLFFLLSQQFEKSSETTAFDLSALDPPRLLPPPSPHAVRAQYCARSAREVLPLPIPSPPLGFSITRTTTTRSLRSLRLKARFTARVPRPRFHCARERISFPIGPSPFSIPLSSFVERVQRIKFKKKEGYGASNRRIFQFLEKLF